MGARRSGHPGAEPALHLVATLAAADPGQDSLYRTRVPEWRIAQVKGWAESRDALLFLDIQPGRVIGSMSAAEINYAIQFLTRIVEEHDLPPKILVVHRFTRRMVRNARDIVTDPRVQVMLHMDGWEPPSQKLDTYRNVVVPEAFQFTGFKLFYRNDTRAGSRLLRPDEILALDPIPFYIQYQ